MNQELVNELLHRALDEAKRLKISITVSVVDNGGHLIAMIREENCSYFGIEASRKKAITASQLKIPSHVLNSISGEFPELKNALNNNREIELLPGGFPLFSQNTILGGIGISGGDFEQDRLIGEYAVKVTL